MRAVIVGGTAEEIESRRDALRRAGVDDAVTFLGKIPPDELPSVLAACDILLSPRIAGSNTPLKLLDYLKAGRAIVATDNAANRLILDEGTAVLVAPDAVAFAEGIRALAQDPERRTQLGAAGRRLIDTTYNYDVFRDRLATCYADVLGEGAPTA